MPWYVISALEELARGEEQEALRQILLSVAQNHIVCSSSNSGSKESVCDFTLEHAGIRFPLLVRVPLNFGPLNAGSIEPIVFLHAAFREFLSSGRSCLSTVEAEATRCCPVALMLGQRAVPLKQARCRSFRPSGCGPH